MLITRVKLIWLGKTVLCWRCAICNSVLFFSLLGGGMFHMVLARKVNVQQNGIPHDVSDNVV